MMEDGIAEVCSDSSDSDEDPDFCPWVPSYLTSSDEEEEISDNEVEMLKAEAAESLKTPTCYMPIWFAVESDAV